MAALCAAGLRPGLLTVSLVGSSGNRCAARDWFRTASGQPLPRFAEADSGWEDVTLRYIREWAAKADPGTAVLYAHAKGSYNLTAVTAKHRELMTAGVVGRWRDAVAALHDHDAAGCFWDGRIFTGNFWWASAGYLARLPEVPCANRYEAENWIGLGNPRIYELAGISYQQLAETILGRPEPEYRGTVMPSGTSRMQIR